MKLLLLIKHAEPEVQRETAPERWHLSERGKRKARALADRLERYAIGRVLSSPEPKALETAAIVAETSTADVEPVAGLHEHRLAGEWFETEGAFEEAVRCFFERPSERVLGQESAHEAQSRFENALAPFLEESDSEDAIAVVSHGRVISLFAAPRLGARPYALWRRLGLRWCRFVSVSQSQNSVRMKRTRSRVRMCATKLMPQ